MATSNDDSDDAIKAIDTLVLIALLICFFPLSILWSGYVFQHVWNWFAPPFTTIRLGYAQAIGVSCLVGLLRGHQYRRDQTTDKPNESKWAMAWTFIMPSVILLVAYLAHASMGH